MAQAGIGSFHHHRIIQRGNRDTLYSSVVFDLDAGPVTIHPERRQALFVDDVIDEDHYVVTIILWIRASCSHPEAGRHALRAGSDPHSGRSKRPRGRGTGQCPAGCDQGQQPGGPGRFEVPNWDPASHQKIRAALVVLAETLPDWRHAAGRRTEVDPIRHLIVTATGWGLDPDKDVIYLDVDACGQ